VEEFCCRAPEVVEALSRQAPGGAWQPSRGCRPLSCTSLNYAIFRRGSAGGAESIASLGAGFYSDAFCLQCCECSGEPPRRDMKMATNMRHVLFVLIVSAIGIQACGEEAFACISAGAQSRWCDSNFVAERRSWSSAFAAPAATCAERLDAARHMASLSSAAAMSPYEPLEWWRIVTQLDPSDETAWQKRSSAARELGDHLTIGDLQAARAEQSFAWHVASLTAASRKGNEYAAQQLQSLIGHDSCN